MKFFDKFSLKIYSLIMLAISIIIGIAAVEIISFSDITDFCKNITNEYFYAVIAVVAILIVWSIRNVINGGKGSNENSSGVLLENKNGKLLITKESINNLIETVVQQNKDVSNVNTKLDFDENNNILVFLNFSVNIGASVKDVTSDIQTKIKDSVKRTTDLDIKEINIKIKNIEQLGGIQD